MGEGDNMKFYLDNNLDAVEMFNSIKEMIVSFPAHGTVVPEITVKKSLEAIREFLIKQLTEKNFSVSSIEANYSGRHHVNTDENEDGDWEIYSETGKLKITCNMKYLYASGEDISAYTEIDIESFDQELYPDKFDGVAYGNF